MNKKNFWNTFLFTVIGVVMAGWIAPGVYYHDAGALLVAALVLGLLNAVLKPLLVIGALPFVVLTLGFGLWLINAGLFYFTTKLVYGFHVSSFWAALGGAAVVSFTQIFMTIFIGGSRVKMVRPDQGPGTSPHPSNADGVNRLPRGPGRGDRDDPKDVIDV